MASLAAIEKKIQEWVTAGILDETSASRIRAHERSVQGNGPGWAMYGIVGLGLFVLATGIISVLASNWQDIPATAKLASFFLVHAGLTFWLIRVEGRPGLVREAVITFTAFLTLAGIGLIGQIFNLESDGWSGLLLWLVLIFPLMYLVRSRLLNNIWIWTFIAVVFIWFTDHTALIERAPATAIASIIGIGFAWITLGILADRLPLPRALLQTGRFWAVILALGALTPFANAMHYADRSFTHELETAGGIVILLSSLLAALVALRISWRTFGRAAAISYGVFLTLLVVSVILPFEVPAMRSRVFGCGLFVLTWSAAAAVAAHLGRKRLFDLATLIIALRFIVVYFEVFGSLLATGFGLISAGLVILGVSYLWHKYRHRLSRLAVGV